MRFERLQGLSVQCASHLVGAVRPDHFALEVAAGCAGTTSGCPSPHDDLREGAEHGPAAGILRQQRRPWMGFLQVFEDRLDWNSGGPPSTTSAGTTLWGLIALYSFGVLAIPAADRFEILFDLHAFESEGGAHAVRAETARIR